MTCRMAVPQYRCQRSHAPKRDNQVSPRGQGGRGQSQPLPRRLGRKSRWDERRQPNRQLRQRAKGDDRRGSRDHRLQIACKLVDAPSMGEVPGDENDDRNDLHKHRTDKRSQIGHEDCPDGGTAPLVVSLRLGAESPAVRRSSMAGQSAVMEAPVQTGACNRPQRGQDRRVACRQSAFAYRLRERRRSGMLRAADAKSNVRASVRGSFGAPPSPFCLTFRYPRKMHTMGASFTTIQEAACR